MRSDAPRWSDRAAAALRALGNRPWSLFLVLFALNAVVLPYAGFIHDARLYGVQVLNKVEGGAFADDLFFRYGSQDKYSVFSTAVAPVVRVAGLDATFFLLYMLSNALLLLGMMRLVRALVKDRVLSTLAVLFLAVSPLPFGGLNIFHVNENFLTPRILAVALTLFALERALRGRHGIALGLAVGGCLFHALMAIGGVLTVVALWAWRRLPRRIVFGLAVGLSAAAVVVLAVPPLGFAVFGRMDADWLSRVRIASAYNFPLEWEPNDWIQLAISLLTVTSAACLLRRKNPRVARLLTVLALAGAGGFVSTLAASEAGYKLLFQAQPYRVLWVLQLLQGPLLLWMAARLWRSGGEPSRVGAVGLAAVGLLGLDLFLYILPFTAFLLTAIWVRGLSARAKRADWLSHSLAGGLTIGALAWEALHLFGFAFYWDRLLSYVDGLDAVRGIVSSPSPLGWLLIAAATLAALHRRFRFGPRFAAAAVVVGFGVQAGYFGCSNTEFYQDHYQRYAADVRFVEKYLDAHRDAAHAPSVYWSTGRPDAIWLRLHARSFFTSLQVQGILFSRDTAMEGQRRALVVRRFEMEQLAADRWVLPDKWIEQMQALFQLKLPDDPTASFAPPTQADLEALCREPDLDIVVVPHAYALPCAGDDGRFYIYDCRQVRAALDGRSTAVADSGRLRDPARPAGRDPARPAGRDPARQDLARR
jgi:hypothetical protein